MSQSKPCDSCFLGFKALRDRCPQHREAQPCDNAHAPTQLPQSDHSGRPLTTQGGWVGRGFCLELSPSRQFPVICLALRGREAKLGFCGPPFSVVISFQRCTSQGV